MSKPRLIGRLAGQTPPEMVDSQPHRRELPDDLLREASRRLEIMAVLSAALWVVGCGLDHVAMWAMGYPAASRFDRDDLIGGVSIVISLVLFLYARRSNRNPRFVLDLGLGYMIYTALALAVMMHWEMPQGFQPSPMLSWVGVVILMFAAVIPSTPKKMAIAGLIAASMNPVCMYAASRLGVGDIGPWYNVLIMHYPDFILVGVAVVISRVVMGLGHQVAQAREMGSYQLGERIAAGGMGEIYRARHRLLARPAAIKLIRPEMLGAGNADGAELAIRRFRREAEVAASLRSPHTVELYDFGETEDRTFYCVMELLDGLDLESLVRQKGPIPAERAIYLLRQACESLAEAHAAGLVHRDIKPANIHVGRLGLQHDFVKVLDFGLVKPAAGSGDLDSLATAAGWTPGTPAYMAPEMARGDEFDGRADLYALGCVGYFLLTGRLVFEAANALQMLTKHLTDIPEPPSRYSEIPVPDALDRAILACLAKQSADRPAGAAEWSRSLAAIETEPWGEEQAAHWWRIHLPA